MQTRVHDGNLNKYTIKAVDFLRVAMASKVPIHSSNMHEQKCSHARFGFCSVCRFVFAPPVHSCPATNKNKNSMHIQRNENWRKIFQCLPVLPGN